MSPLSLEILIPTYNGGGTLQECLASLLQADPPERMRWRVTVIDNSSHDDTPDIVRSFTAKAADKVRYLFERRQGKSFALNLGIRNTDADLIGMIDDDELVDRAWLKVIEDCFADPSLDYIGGPYIGCWSVEKPEWLPPSFPGVLSADDAASLPPKRESFDTPGLFLRGGNAVVRCRLFERLGHYDTELGPSGTSLASCDDHDMFLRMKAAGAIGLYVPELVVYHLVPARRVTRSYFRRWVAGRSVSMATMDRKRHQKVPHIGRIPRCLISCAVRGTPSLLSRSAALRFDAELTWRTLLVYGYTSYFKSDRSPDSAADVRVEATLPHSGFNQLGRGRR